MPKVETLVIQEAVCELDRSLGFISDVEEINPSSPGCYTPRYDVVWYLDT